MTAPSARNKSENSSEDVPREAPSLASGTTALVALIVCELVPATSKLPLISTLPFISINVAFNSISSVAFISNTVALGAVIF